MHMTTFKTVYLAGFVLGSAVRLIYTRGRGAPAAGKRHRCPLDSALTALSGATLMLPLIYLFTGWLAFADYARPAWLGWIGAGGFAIPMHYVTKLWHEQGHHRADVQQEIRKKDLCRRRCLCLLWRAGRVVRRVHPLARAARIRLRAGAADPFQP